ncbi:hypothetical protein BGW38_002057 [Lunasporangiospora selenospora]|uniref:Uncharacterized protein n=1 Tax=Lunasporangiospora selenospora TaxID=979761 RepID=A0A9P6KHT1_9FUNG|nr:hypothetical protein BGW38_002057 [Lunasporangiospora selenospora]
MHKSILFLAAIVLGSAAVQAESGSWCYSPKNEKFWGQASAECCRPAGGSMGGDRRCYGLNGDLGKCRAFYACCIDTWGSGNHYDNACY